MNEHFKASLFHKASLEVSHPIPAPTKHTHTHVLARGLAVKETVLERDCCLSHKLSPGGNLRCTLQIRLRDGLIPTDAHSDTNQRPCLTSCSVLVPETGCCPDPVKHVSQLQATGSIQVLVPPLPYTVLRCLPRSLESISSGNVQHTSYGSFA